jgi:hypothetical protein
MDLFFTLIWGNFLSLFSPKRLKILHLKSNERLNYIGELYEKQHIKCLIDGPCPLGSGAQMLQYFGDGRHKEKIILTVE